VAERTRIIRTVRILTVICDCPETPCVTSNVGLEVEKNKLSDTVDELDAELMNVRMSNAMAESEA